MKKKPPVITILVPLHQQPQFVSLCLASLQAQSLDRIEILCLNQDADTASLTIAKSFARQDKRFHTVTGQYPNLGALINKGLSLAQGEYLSIVDSYDWVEPEMLAYLYARACKYQVDIIQSNGYFQNQREGQRQVKLLPLQTLQTNLPFEWREQLMLPPTSPWTALYRLDYLRQQKLKFLTTAHPYFYDVDFTLTLFSGADKICLVPRIFYHRHYPLHVTPMSPHQLCSHYQALTQHWQKSHQLTAYAPVLTASKYRLYHHSSRRLPLSTLKDYLRQAQNDLLTQKQAGYLQTRLITNFFSRLDLWLMMYYPTLYAYKTKFTSWT